MTGQFEPRPPRDAEATGPATTAALAAGGATYEYRVLTLPRGTTRGEARALLTEQAEYGRWELARVLLHLGGTRKVWLRRRILRVRRTL